MVKWISLELKKSLLWETVVSPLSCTRVFWWGLHSSVTQLWYSGRMPLLGIRRLGPCPTLPLTICETLGEPATLPGPYLKVETGYYVLGVFQWDDGILRWCLPHHRSLVCYGSFPASTPLWGGPERVCWESCLHSAAVLHSLLIYFSFQFFLGVQLVRGSGAEAEERKLFKAGAEERK